MLPLNQQEGNDPDAPLEGAQVRLELLRESLYKREREISMLMGGEGGLSAVSQSAYAHLLAATIRQVYTAMEEIRVFPFILVIVCTVSGSVCG